jgi:hypothetical protein
VGTPEPGAWRIGTAEREQAVKELGDHFAQGRLEAHEFEERMTAAYAARTAVELERLFHDLPRPGDAARPAPAPPPQGIAGRYPAPTTGPYHVQPRGGFDPQAPWGREPLTGQPYSDRSKVIAGLLQLFFPLGVGRLYAGHMHIGVAQLVLSFIGIGVIWAFIDGIVILAGRPTDSRGRPLRP